MGLSLLEHTDTHTARTHEKKVYIMYSHTETDTHSFSLSFSRPPFLCLVAEAWRGTLEPLFIHGASRISLSNTATLLGGKAMQTRQGAARGEERGGARRKRQQR